MPNYIYGLYKDDELVDIIECLKAVEEREEPIIIGDLEYVYLKGHMNLPTNFQLSGAGWTSNSKIIYEDKALYNKRVEDEHLRKKFVAEYKEKSELDSTYSDRIHQGLKNISEGLNPNGSVSDDCERLPLENVKKT